MPEAWALATEEVAEQFEDLAHQRQADRLGMWTFLTTEALLFGAVFVCFAAYRLGSPAVFHEAAGELYLWIGAGNTVLLLLSSLSMSLAILAAEEERARPVAVWLTLTALLGLAFLGLKGWEYWLDWRGGTIPGAGFQAAKFSAPAPATMFFVCYLILTGMHVLHLSAGVLLVAWLLIQQRRGRLRPRLVELGGLYWHFVDVVWLCIFSAFYLAGP